MLSGEISSGHASVIGEALAQLPSSCGEADRARVEDLLVEQARTIDRGRLRGMARRALAELDQAHVDEVVRSRWSAGPTGWPS